MAEVFLAKFYKNADDDGRKVNVVIIDDQFLDAEKMVERIERMRYVYETKMNVAHYINLFMHLVAFFVGYFSAKFLF